eukprot:12415822-Karenia_brevis.AAC.1
MRGAAKIAVDPNGIRRDLCGFDCVSYAHRAQSWLQHSRFLSGVFPQWPGIRTGSDGIRTGSASGSDGIRM